MIENRHVSRVLQNARVIFPPFSLTHNFWRQIWTTRRLVVCTRKDMTISKEDFTWTSSYFFSMFSLTLETKVTRIHCTSTGCLNTVLEYIKCIKRTCKVGDFQLETSEEQRLDWLDNSVRCWVLSAKMCKSFCWSSAAVIELPKEKVWSFFLLIQLVTRTANYILLFQVFLLKWSLTKSSGLTTNLF